MIINSLEKFPARYSAAKEFLNFLVEEIREKPDRSVNNNDGPSVSSWLK